jgi:hypothetical protein
VGASQCQVLWEHVGQAGGVAQQVAYPHGRPIGSRKLRQIACHRVVQRHQATLDQQQHRHGIDRLGDRGQQVHRIGRGTMARVQHHTPMAGHEHRGGGHTALRHLGGEQGRSTFQALRAHALACGRVGRQKVGHGTLRAIRTMIIAQEY